MRSDSTGHRTAPGSLPAELSRFVGRRSEAAELERLIGSSRLVTVVGVGGVGKTRLATQVAETLQERFCDGVWLAELSALRDPELVEHTLVEALGLTDHTSRPPREVLTRHLAGRELLLVVDGFEFLVDACAGLLLALLRSAPGLRVIAVGRRPLEIEGELPLPLGPMRDRDAVRLFTERVSAGRPGFRFARSDTALVAEVCRRLDGIPLALELAAGRMRALSVEQLLARLDDRFRVLTGGGRGVLPRHRTLRTAIGWSHELCTPEQRLLWARLSVFPGQFDLEAAEYICAGPELPSDGVLEVLDELLAQSVLVREDTPAGVRYRMLDTIRDYGAQWLAATGDTEQLRRRHRDWFLGLATWCELDWFSPRQTGIAARVDSELPNLRGALEFSLEHSGDVHLAQYLAGTLWFYWAGCGRLAEGRHWLEHVLEAESGHDGSRLKALWVLGYVAVLQGDAVAAVAALHECHEAAQHTGDEVAAAYALHRTGCLALVTDDMPRAEELLREAIGQYRELGELNSNVLMGQVELAMAVCFRGRLAEAVAICQDVVTVCEDHGERWARAYALYVLAFEAWSDGRAARSRELLSESLATSHAFHDQLGTVLALELMALLALEGGEATEAALLQGAAGRLWSSVGLPLFGSAYYNAPHQRCEEGARRKLGPEVYESFLSRGAQLGRDAAVARALHGPAAREDPPPPAPRGARGRRAEAMKREVRPDQRA
ncbi:AAA family ATPase [Streptomyces sp. NBC_01020]|uniref:ATP-binding protein n=1 Tax=unclassified Streptomyces TaxID=2593676 RepID=UPI002E1B6448|nr:AAA family ATPase [Streptomyces sp. NBC_01020]WSX70948.1 AAA family ATPase [Streptomyces sp. NBC_00932]